MYLTKHATKAAAVWAVNGKLLSTDFNLRQLLQLPRSKLLDTITRHATDAAASNDLLAPLEDDQEVWASGVTYYRSCDAREAETDVKNVYTKVYQAQRPELFFKAIGWRVAGSNHPIRIRSDSCWNVPEPELTLVINSRGEICGYCVGNDMSSRDIEGENPLYLPQAKMYDGSCALGPGIRIVPPELLTDLPIQIEIFRDELLVFSDHTRSSQINRSLESLTGYLLREMTFPYGVFLMTGTGIVPPEDFTLQAGDRVRIDIDSLVLENIVHS
jgi:2-dehydro-3-deoxy-D-arabinonate dehydratase